MNSTIIRWLWFNLSYWLPGKPPWDSGISPPELVEVVEGSEDRPPRPTGRALDLGCGTGTNVTYLARHGWQAVGVDYAGRAIRAARRKAAGLPPEAAARCTFYQGDVARLDLPGEKFDLALDMGCFHSLAQSQRGRYAAGLADVLRPGAIYLLYAFKPDDGWDGGVVEEHLPRIFGPAFRMIKVEEGKGRPSAWYTLERQ